MTDRSSEIRSTRAPKLREDQIEVLSHYGQTRKTEAGQVLFRAGDPSSDFIVALEGEGEGVAACAGGAARRRARGAAGPLRAGGPFRRVHRRPGRGGGGSRRLRRRGADDRGLPRRPL